MSKFIVKQYDYSTCVVLEGSDTDVRVWRHFVGVCPTCGKERVDPGNCLAEAEALCERLNAALGVTNGEEGAE